jgi:hypothetical protein
MVDYQEAVAAAAITAAATSGTEAASRQLIGRRLFFPFLFCFKMFDMKEFGVAFRSSAQLLFGKYFIRIPNTKKRNEAECDG